MWATSPLSAQYRITLFYGPEPMAEDASVQTCVFNVKKRSWKAGVQVAVELDQATLEAAQDVLHFEDELSALLASVPDAERADHATRARDLFIQALCALKLELALEHGVPQENQRVAWPRHLEALRDQLPTARGRILQHIRAELDLPLD